jgi:formylglycine-generating enzyme required for sulfatase activity
MTNPPLPDLKALLGIDFPLLDIPGGQITLRDDRTKQQWTVDLPPFRLSKFPVTQALYHAVTGASPSTFPGPQHPVESVSWLDAVRFCNALSLRAGLTPAYDLHADGSYQGFDPQADGFRLPTEAEWEYACRAGTTGVRYGELDAIAWHKGNSGGTTRPVGQLAPNAWGLHDLLGNVWEWCNDIYDPSVYGDYRIFRGGGWNDVARSVMATNRRRSHPVAFCIDDLGFRVGMGELEG